MLCVVNGKNFYFVHNNYYTLLYFYVLSTVLGKKNTVYI